MTILFCGGGTLGPVTPLLAVARKMKMLRRDCVCVWAGTQEGPEKIVVTKEGISFVSIPIAKFPRYPTVRWLTWPRDYLRARQAARALLDEIRPQLVIGAGGFTQVPLMREAFRRNIPCVIHQLDVTPTLSNQIVAKQCQSVTTSFEYLSPPFGRSVQTPRLPTPCRFANMTIPDKEAAASYFFLDSTRPIVFLLGGGTGALALNRVVEMLRARLPTENQYINITGSGRGIGLASDRRTVVKEFLDEKDMRFAYAAADVVICRAGMGTLAELATFRKAAIVIPMPDSHQEKNAEALKDGIVIVKQKDGFEQRLEEALKELLDDPSRCLVVGEALHCLLPTDDGTSLAERWLDTVRL